jgi:hypothetical protein
MPDKLCTEGGIAGSWSRLGYVAGMTDMAGHEPASSSTGSRKARTSPQQARLSASMRIPNARRTARTLCGMPLTTKTDLAE